MIESTFERCDHDRENPYVMISREMAQDKSISPKAKGVLLYLLSLPKDWKIFHSQLQNGLGVGEDYINSAMDELIATGYADRTRDRVKGIFQPYKYKIREFKKLNPNLKNQTGSASPVNPDLQKREEESKEKEQQQAAVAAAAVSLKKNEDQIQKTIYPCLQELDIPKKEKVWITRKYDEETVRNAIAWATSDQTEIKTTLVQAIKWACQNRPEVPKNKDLMIAENKAYATPYDEMCCAYGMINVLGKYVEFASIGASVLTTYINYDDKDFKLKLENMLLRWELI